MPTLRDQAFAETLDDAALSIDKLCLRLAAAMDTRADKIIMQLREVEADCEELAEQVSA